MSQRTVFESWRRFSCPTKVGEMDGYHCDNPGLISETEKQELFQHLYPVALSAFSQEHTPEREADVWKHIFSSQGLLLVVDQTSDDYRVVAFRMWDVIWFDLLEGDILYLAGMCVKKEYQKIGIGSSLLRYVLARDEHRRTGGMDQFCPLPPCTYVALRTQSPVMKKCFDEATGVVSYPRAPGEEIPVDIQKAAARVAEHLHDDSFLPERLVSPNLYGGSLYGVSPCSEDDRYQSLFSNLDASGGDAMVCVWHRG